MYFLSEHFRSESNSEPVRWNIRGNFLRKLFTGTARKLFLQKTHFNL